MPKSLMFILVLVTMGGETWRFLLDIFVWKCTFASQLPAEVIRTHKYKKTEKCVLVLISVYFFINLISPERVVD